MIAIAQASPIMSPGSGPNGPGPIDMRRPISSVSNQSTIPYGPTNGYANPGMVMGFIGPAAGSLRKPTTWFVRTGGSNANGGTGTSLTPERSGTDGGASNASTTFTAASGAFTSADIGKGIMVGTGVTQHSYKIVGVISSTQITLDRLTNNSLSAGTTPWAIGGAWADLKPALGDSTLLGGESRSAANPGDTVYVGTGTYRAVYSVGNSAAALPYNGQLNIVGDVTGQYTGDSPGMVQFTGYTTNDRTAPSATTILNLNGKSNLAFSNIFFVIGGATCITATTSGATSQNISFTDCSFYVSKNNAGPTLLTATCQANVSFNWIFDRCSVISPMGASIMTFTFSTSPLAEYNANVQFSNCLILGGSGANSSVQVTNSGTLAFNGGGVVFYNITHSGGGFIATTAARISTIFPCRIKNSFLYEGANTALLAGTSGQIVESNNLIVAGTPRTNVSVGAGSVSDGSYASLFHFGQERIWNALLRRFGEPMANSPLLGFGNDGAQTNYDLFASPRPAGTDPGSPYPSAGALERSNTSQQGLHPTAPSGTYNWFISGPGYQDFLIPVSALATTIAVSVQRDSSYSPYTGGSNPSMLILANPTIGVAAQTIVDSGAINTWNTLTSASFTPTAAGWITVRMVSYDGTGLSTIEFADFVIT